MRRKKNKKRSKVGMAPGTPIFTGTQKMSQIGFSVIRYNEDSFEVLEPQTTGEVIRFMDSAEKITWVNIDGLHDEKTVEELCMALGMHKLSVEDILSVSQRPKIEEYNTYIHAVIRNINFDETDNSIDYEQISFILKGNLLVSFQEKTGNVLESVKTRICENKGSVRKKGADYLLYALFDCVIDQYFSVLDKFGDKLEDLETQLLDNPNKNTLNQLHNLRRETLGLRRSIYPVREMIGDFEKMEEQLVSNNIKVFIRDLYDHSLQVIETIEIFRDTTSSLLDLYINSVSNRTNEIMKVLTILTSIFIPLTFLTGLYGMNFVNMPELQLKNGYFYLLLLMVVVVSGMIYFLKRRKWL